MSLITECTHGMPTPASCVQCMAEGAVLPPRPSSTEVLVAHQWTTARFATRCARVRDHLIDPGDRIGFVEEIGGWCCEECARPGQGVLL